MSNQLMTGMESLDRRTPLPTISNLLSETPLPAITGDLPPFKDLMPPLTQLPKVSPISLPPKKTTKFTPIPPDASLADRVARTMENSHRDFATSPPPLPAPSNHQTSSRKTPSFPPLPKKAGSPIQSAGKPVPSPEMSYPIPSPFEPKEENLELPDDDSEAQIGAVPSAFHPTKTSSSPETDEDLIQALLPLVESTLEKALSAPQTGLHTYLEPMLRSTVRRAIAEQMQTTHHFGSISTSDRLTWRMKALFTSQTFDDIVFDRTHRYQVEEVFLMRYDTFSLISYASHDPSRHANAKKIRYDLGRLVAEFKDSEGELKKAFDLPDKRTALLRPGRHGFLVAVVRGRANVLVCADLDYTLEQVEQRFEKRLRPEGDQFIHVLQPILESCLLIQSPAPPR
jgi:hypothetical protein